MTEIGGSAPDLPRWQPSWYVLYDAEWCEVGTPEQFYRCFTEQVSHDDLGVQGYPVQSFSAHCVEPATVEIIIQCRSCGPKTFEVCNEELWPLRAGVAHEEPWCVYCTEAAAAHEVTSIEVVP